MATTHEAQATTGSRRHILAFAPELALLTVVSLWASTFVVTKDALESVHPLAFTSARFLVMVVLAFTVLFVAGRREEGGASIRREDLPRFLAASLTGYTLYQLGFVLGLDRVSPFSAALLQSLMPFFTMLLLTLRREPTTLSGWIGLSIAFAGVVVFLLDKREGDGLLLGNFFSLGAALSFAAYGLVNRPLVQKYPPATYTAYSLLFGAIPLFVVGMPATLRQDWAELPASAWLAIAYMAVLPVYVAYMLWNWGIARRGAAVATSFSLLLPVISGIFSVFFFDEAFPPGKLFGAGLVLV
ncbi:MAG: DMT family transporter, partial [Thermomicrobiales bacterium]